MTQIESIWGPTERYSLSEMASAASMAKTTLPDSAIQTDIWQYPPSKVAELRAARGAELIFQAPGTTLAPVPPSPAIPPSVTDPDATLGDGTL